MKRKFNKSAYDKMDMPCKLAIKKIMENKGYKVYDGLDEEVYKKYDISFIKENKIISFENEMRKAFDSIKNYYDTIHIPIRKAENQSDYYIVWNLDCTEFFMIETKIIREYAKKSIIEVDCNEGTEYNYKEDFIDIPKTLWKLFKNG